MSLTTATPAARPGRAAKRLAETLAVSRARCPSGQLSCPSLLAKRAQASDVSDIQLTISSAPPSSMPEKL
jgi:hypothetical protein